MHFFSQNICVCQKNVVPLQSILKFLVKATLAQLVEQRIRNA